VPTRYFKEASSVNFRRSVVYGLSTLNVMWRFLLSRWGAVRYPQFKKTLPEIISRYHQSQILRRPPSAQTNSPGDVPTEGGSHA